MNFILTHIFIIILFIINLYINYVHSLNADEITSLPGLSHIPKFKQYSGYLNASKGRHYFYWFVESQNNPAKDPLILWLNGGPGCSSLFGLLGENGPFRVHKDGKTLIENPNSWNKIANVLYLESPAGVGFSYDENNDYKNGDKRTAENNFLAVDNFFQRFPQLKSNSFYISGESYAGVYIPMLALEIFKRNSSINLKGVAIGNGLLDSNQFSRIEFALTHGLISTDFVNRLNADCCNCDQNREVCTWSDLLNSTCNPNYELAMKLEQIKMNPYNIYSDCPVPGGYESYYQQIYRTFEFDFEFSEELTEYYEQTEFSRDDCPGNGHIQYLNSEDVRKAIHVNQKIERWVECNGNMSYTLDRGSTREERSMKTTVNELISKYKIQTFIVLNGDIDIVCDFIGNQEFVDKLGLTLTQKSKKWSVNGVTAGFVKRYEGITFMTVRGAGHMVPADKPEAALKIVRDLVGISKVDD